LLPSATPASRSTYASIATSARIEDAVIDEFDRYTVVAKKKAA